MIPILTSVWHNFDPYIQDGRHLVERKRNVRTKAPRIMYKDTVSGYVNQDTLFRLNRCADAIYEGDKSLKVMVTSGQGH